MDPEKLFSALQALVQAKSETEARNVLAEHPELLDEEVDFYLEQIASHASQDEDANASELIGQLRELLRIERSSSTMRSFLKVRSYLGYLRRSPSQRS